jgi:catalase (peroxidase I)
VRRGRAKGWENLAAHLRGIFRRMGLSDKELVTLMCGGHVYGRCHTEHSGYAGAWVEEPTKFSNEYAADLIEDEWMMVTHDTKVSRMYAENWFLFIFSVNVGFLVYCLKSDM